MNSQHQYLWRTMDQDEDFLESYLVKHLDFRTLLNN
jgi:transposase-like protein